MQNLEVTQGTCDHVGVLCTCYSLFSQSQGRAVVNNFSVNILMFALKEVSLQDSHLGAEVWGRHTHSWWMPPTFPVEKLCQLAPGST